MDTIRVATKLIRLARSITAPTIPLHVSMPISSLPPGRWMVRRSTHEKSISASRKMVEEATGGPDIVFHSRMIDGDFRLLYVALAADHIRSITFAPLREGPLDRLGL